MKPCNYKGWLPYVNLICRQAALGIHPAANCQDCCIGVTGNRPHLTLDIAAISFISNRFGR